MKAGIEPPSVAANRPIVTRATSTSASLPECCSCALGIRLPQCSVPSYALMLQMALSERWQIGCAGLRGGPTLGTGLSAPHGRSTSLGTRRPTQVRVLFYYKDIPPIGGWRKGASAQAELAFGCKANPSDWSYFKERGLTQILLIRGPPAQRPPPPPWMNQPGAPPPPFNFPGGIPPRGLPPPTY